MSNEIRSHWNTIVKKNMKINYWEAHETNPNNSMTISRETRAIAMSAVVEKTCLQGKRNLKILIV